MGRNSEPLLAHGRGTCPGVAAAACRDRARRARPAPRLTTLPTASIASSGARWAPPSGSAMTVVDDLELLEVARRHLHRLGRVLGIGVVAPQDGGAAFRRDHRVDRVLQHVDAVGRGDGERPARAAFADHDADQRHAERRGRCRSRSRSPRPGRAPRRRGRDRRPACRPAPRRESGNGRPASSGAAPCDSLRAWPCRNCA